MSHLLRTIYRLAWAVILLGVPWMTNCVCVPPSFQDCRTHSDCISISLNMRCVQGSCRSNTEPPSTKTCSVGQTRTCFRVNVRVPSNCRTGKALCLNGKWSTCQIDITRKRLEICNGIDDDCDGRVDESFPEKNKTCTVPGALGPCAKGEYRSCSRRKLVCFSTTLSRPEGEAFGNCSNGVDDNCNGFVDDPVNDGCTRCVNGSKRSCYSFGQGLQDPTIGKGLCKAGSQVCKGGKWTTCVGAVLPTKEVCGNQIDEDCDGTPDNQCNSTKCNPGEQRSCYNGPVSTLRVGTCTGGQQVCAPTGKWGICVGEVLPRSEICGNKKDDDCNGILDDCDPNSCAKGDTRPCYTGPKGTAKVGACKAGVEACTVDGKWSGTCVGERLPTKDICGNNLDEDCNGKTDDCQISQLISGSWDKLSPLLLWDLKSGTSVRAFQGHSDAVYAAHFSPDGKTLVSASHDKLVLAWNVDTGKRLWKSTKHTGPVYGLQVDPKGKFVVTVSEDKTLRVADLATGTEIGFQTAHAAAIYSLAMDSTGRWVATGSADTTVRLWDLKTQSKPTLTQTFTGHALGVFAVAFDPKGRWIASGGRDGVVKLWKLTGGVGPTLSYKTASVTSLAFSKRTNWLAIGSSDGTTALFDLSGTTPKAGRILKQTKYGAVYSLAFHPTKDELVSGHYNNVILTWDLSTGKVSSTWNKHSGPVSSLSFRP